jgi:hypothetical protein
VRLDDDAEQTADRMGRAAADVDVVIDYLWGEPAAAAMIAVVTNRADRGKPLSWIQIGSVAGPTAPIPPAASTSTPGPCRSPTPSKHGPRPPTPSSASSSPRSCPSWTWRCHQGPFRNFMIVLVARRWGGRGVRT